MYCTHLVVFHAARVGSSFGIRSLVQRELGTFCWLLLAANVVEQARIYTHRGRGGPCCKQREFDSRTAPVRQCKAAKADLATSPRTHWRRQSRGLRKAVASASAPAEVCGVGEREVEPLIVVPVRVGQPRLRAVQAERVANLHIANVVEIELSSPRRFGKRPRTCSSTQLLNDSFSRASQGRQLASLLGVFGRRRPLWRTIALSIVMPNNSSCDRVDKADCRSPEQMVSFKSMTV